MKQTSKNAIYVTTNDFTHLESLVAQHPETAADLQEEMDRAQIVPSERISPLVVTMNSRVKYLDEATRQLKDVMLVFPKDADISEGKVSVLAPVGVALLGSSVGQTVECTVPHGETKTLKIVDVRFQPEAVAHGWNRDWENRHLMSA
jgi:regulator of nucleoside diphosphate kinase